MLLGITQFQSWLGLVAFALCLTLIGHAILAPWPKDRSSSVQPRLSTLVFGVPLVFCASWLWLSIVLPLLAWGMWIGDNQHWFYDASPSLAGAVAGILCLVVTFRVLARNARRGYARVQLVGAALLMLLFGLCAIHEVATHIRGSNPEVAARRVLQDAYPFIATTARTLTEENRTSTCITYSFSDEREPQARITVCRYGRWWWKTGGTQLLIPHPVVWQEIERFREQYPERAKSMLRDVIKQYPNSEASQRAEELLQAWPPVTSRDDHGKTSPQL